MKNNFGENLKRIRQEKGVSQRMLAQMLSIDESNISKWENNKISPQVAWVYKIAEKLEVNPSAFIT